MAKYVYVSNQSQTNTTFIRARRCVDFLPRLRGLMFRRSLPQDEGILLIQKKDSVIDASIHMLCMWMDLAVIWINSSNQVVDVKHTKRQRFAYFPDRPARYVLELSVDHIDMFKIGDHVIFSEEPPD